MEQSHLQLASGEKVIRSCDYRTITGKKYERVDNFTLTDRRLISRTNERIDDVSSVNIYEVPVEQIDTVKTFYRDDKKPVSITMILLVAILTLLTVLMFVTNNGVVYGLVGVALTVIVLLLAIFLRKRQFMFSLDVGRLAGGDTNEHLTTGATAVKATAKNATVSKRAHKRLKLRNVVSMIAFLSMVACVILFITKSLDDFKELKNILNFISENDIEAPRSYLFIFDTLIVPLSYLGGALVSLIALIIARATKKSDINDGESGSSRKIKNVTVKSKKQSTQMPVEEIKTFLDEVGALVRNIKESKKTTNEKEI